MVCEAGHVDAAETGQKVALLVEVRVAWDLRVVGTLGEVLISMVIRMNRNDADSESLGKLFSNMIPVQGTTMEILCILGHP